VESLNLDFKSPLNSRIYFLVILVDCGEYLRFLSHSRAGMRQQPVSSNVFDKLFALRGTADSIHADNRPCFVSKEFKIIYSKEEIFKHIAVCIICQRIVGKV